MAKGTMTLTKEPGNGRVAKLSEATLERLRAAWAEAFEAATVAERAAAAEVETRLALEEKSRFLAALAHDLKNPLNAILGYAQLLRLPSFQGDAKSRDEKLETIEAASRHMSDLVGNILTSAQIESGRLVVDPTEVDLDSLIAEVVALNRSNIEARRNRLTLDLSKDLGVIHSDRLKISQILNNLLSNAAKFTEDGDITLSAMRARDGSVTFTVTDTGPGLSEEQQARLFGAFSSVGGRKSRELGGHGLGLYITTQLISLLGGRIDVRSRLGEGTRFSIWLPDQGLGRVPATPSETPSRDLRGSARTPADSYFSDRTLVIGFPLALPLLDPHRQQLDCDSFLLGTVYQGLTALDDRGELIPCLAKSWRKVDQRTWVFELDRKRRFHSGAVVEAADVVGTLDRISRLRADPGYGAMTAIVATLEQWHAVEERAVVIRAHHNATMLPQQLAHLAILPRHIADEDEIELATSVGTGPYKLVSDSFYEMRLVAQPEALAIPATKNSGSKAMYWPEVIARRTFGVEGMRRDFETGRIDVAGQIDRDVARGLANSTRLRVVSPGPSLSYYLLPNFIETRHPIAWWPGGRIIPANPMHSIVLRRALAASIDQQFLCRVALRGLGEPLLGSVPRDHFGAHLSQRVEPYDPDHAQALLREAGYEEGITLSVAVVDEPGTDDRRIARALQPMFSAAKINLRFRYMSLRELSARNGDPRVALVLLGRATHLNDAGELLRDLLATPDPAVGLGRVNFGHYSNDELDLLLDRAQRELDPDERHNLLQECCKLVDRELALIPLVTSQEGIVCRHDLDLVGRFHLWLKPHQIVHRDPDQAILDMLLD